MKRVVIIVERTTLALWMGFSFVIFGIALLRYLSLLVFVCSQRSRSFPFWKFLFVHGAILQ